MSSAATPFQEALSGWDAANRDAMAAAHRLLSARIREGKTVALKGPDREFRSLPLDAEDGRFHAVAIHNAGAFGFVAIGTKKKPTGVHRACANLGFCACDFFVFLGGAAPDSAEPDFLHMEDFMRLVAAFDDPRRTRRAALPGHVFAVLSAVIEGELARRSRAAARAKPPA